MEHLKIMNAKEKKEIFEIVKGQWGADIRKVMGEMVFLRSRKDNIYVVSKDFEKLDDKNLHIDSVGLYFAEFRSGIKHEFRLSIEGSQLIGPSADKNVVELSKEEAKQWFRGEDIKKDIAKCWGYLILKTSSVSGFDYIGCGKYKDKDKVILNYVPKTRRIAGVF